MKEPTLNPEIERELNDAISVAHTDKDGNATYNVDWSGLHNLLAKVEQRARDEERERMATYVRKNAITARITKPDYDVVNAKDF